MISCDHHDYIEIVCTFRYPVKLTLKSGDVHEGVSRDVLLNKDRVECIKIDQNGAEVMIVLDDIATVDVLVDNPHFTTVSFVD